MKYGKIENYKVVGTCLMQTEDFPDIIPDNAELFDYVLGDSVFKADQYRGKILTVTAGVASWADDIEAAKQEKLAEISTAYTAERTTRNKGIISVTLGAEIDCRESDITNISSLITYLTATGVAEYFYKCRDNSEIPCTVEQIKSVLTELITAQLSMWTVKQTLSKAVETATTAAEIQAITWQWPVID